MIVILFNFIYPIYSQQNIWYLFVVQNWTSSMVLTLSYIAVPHFSDITTWLDLICSVHFYSYLFDTTHNNFWGLLITQDSGIS